MVDIISRGLEHEELVRSIRIRIAVVVFAMLGIFLFSSELMNAIFNNRLDEGGADLWERIVFAFKPTVIAIYIFFASLLYLLISRYLKPLFLFLLEGREYDQARKSVISVPWVIILFQILAWTLGTTAYYIIKSWEAESGIPFSFGLPLKISVGLISGVYTSIFFNLILIPAKARLNIVNMRAGENDTFSRNRDYYVVLAIIVLLIVNFSYVTYYFSRARQVVTLESFYLPIIFFSLFYGLASFGLMYLSKKEYGVQINSINQVLARMAKGNTKLDERIYIINYNELGESASWVNGILDNFYNLLQKISETSRRVGESSGTLAETSQKNAAQSSQQAASTTEIVSTMENLDELSRNIGEQAGKVENSAEQMKESINDGVRITRENIDKMKELRDSYQDTIQGMKDLGEHISGIWEIVKMINDIAGQIKIIAFNAALEAAAAGKEGKNFEIVATEIRRLADNTVSSTDEIRSRITDIQRASDRLVGSSEEDTVKIQGAWQMSNRIEEVFSQILSHSENSLVSARDMNQAVSRQTHAFSEILKTAKQISEGIHAASASIEDTRETARALENTVETLNTIVARSAKK